MQKLYCYVDETGQDTRGRFFIVDVVVVEKNTEVKDKLEQQLVRIEKEVGKRTDWRHTRPSIKTMYLKRIMNLKWLKGNILYGFFRESKDYDQRIAQTVITAIQTKAKKPYKVSILIEGELGETRKRRIIRTLRTAKIRYRLVRGLRFKSSALIRLADACAGFMGDRERGKPYVSELFPRLKRQKLFQRII